MKKIFSAFLLMTMMVASVGSFVSCSDIEESIAAVDEATKNNADAVEALKSEVAALKTALATAQADAAAAKAEANAAKQAAATAKAEAIAAALAEIEKVNGDVDAMQAVIDSINAALTGKADKATVELLQATLDEYKALNDAAVSENATAIAALEEALAALGENVTPEQLAEVVAKMEAIDAALIAFQSRIQSIAYVAQTMTAPKATQFTVGKEKTDYIIQLAYQVSPVSAAAELENAEVYFKGIATKAEAPAKFETKVLSVDEKTGMVEAVAYIPEETVKAVELKDKEVPGVVIALAIENENGVEITSTYEKFVAASETLANYVALKDFEDGEYTYEIPYDTAIADSKVDMINPEFIVNVAGMFDETPLAEVLEYLGLEDVTVERTPANRFGKEYIEIKNNSEYDPDEDVEDDEFEVLKATQSADKKDVTVEFSADYAKVADPSELADEVDVVVTLKEGFFTIAGDKLPKATITYAVVGKKNNVTIEIDDIESPWVPVPSFKDVPYSGIAKEDFNKYHTATVALVDADDNENGKATIVATSHDDMTVTLTGFTWPEETTTYTVKHEFKGAKDNKTATQTIYSYEFTITVEGRPEDVEFEYAPATLPTLPLTAMPYPNDPTKLEGKDPVKDLASKVVVGTVVTDITAEYAAYYEKDVLADSISKRLEKATWAVYELDIDTDELVDADTSAKNGITPIALENVQTKKGVYFDYVAATTTAAEKSQFVFPYSVANYGKIAGKALQLVTVLENVSGVNYEITANIQASTWAGPATSTISVVPGVLSPVFQGTQPVEYSTVPEVVYVTGTDVVDNATGNAGADGLDDNDGSKVQVIGGVIYKLDNDGNKIVDWYTTYITPKTAPVAYNLNKVFNFKDYVKVTINDTDATKNYQVRWYVSPKAGTYYTGTGTTDDPYKANTAITYPVYAVNGSANAALTTFVYDTKTVNNVTSVINACNNGAGYYQGDLATFNKYGLAWDGTNLNEYTIKVEIVLENTDPATKVATPWIVKAALNGGAGLTFSTPATISAVNTTDVEVKWNEATTNVAAGVTVTDMFNVPVYNQGANRTIETFWNNFSFDSAATTADNKNTSAYNESLTPVYVTVGNATTGNTYFSNAYQQTIKVVEFDHDGYKATDKVWISNNGGYEITDVTGDVVTGDHFTFNTKTGEFSFTSGTAPANDVTFTVHVQVGYMNDNTTPIEKTVNIVVKK